MSLDNYLWLYPFLYSLKHDLDLNISSSLRKSLLYYSMKFGLVRKVGNKIEVTEKGEELLRQYVPLNDSLKRLKVKGPDGCFLVVVRRKRGVKVFRVPC